MAKQECPKCGTKFRVSGGWASTAVSTLLVAPAVPDMATQMRCPQCGHFFAHGEIRYLHSSGSKGLAFVLVLLCVGLLVWALS
jgi:predicted RNA-binding Zn-ribbon protein involved in translation (DUF1610 family)